MDLLDVIDLGPAPGVEGTCHLCRDRPFRMRCRACGKGTCAADLWTMFALCRACVPEDQMSRWHLRGVVDGENWLAGPSGADEAIAAGAPSGDPAERVGARPATGHGAPGGPTGDRLLSSARAATPSAGRPT
jgi:hypothetical protein